MTRTSAFCVNQMNTEKVAALSLSGSNSTDEVRMTGRDQKASRCLRSPTWAVWHSLSASQSTQKVEKVTLYQEDQTGTFDSPPPLKNTHSFPHPPHLKKSEEKTVFQRPTIFPFHHPILGVRKGRKEEERRSSLASFRLHILPAPSPQPRGRANFDLAMSRPSSAGVDWVF